MSAELDGGRRELREALIDATLAVIRERGLARTRTSHIARAAGCAEGSIYRYFAGKSELVYEVLRSRLPNMIGLLAELPDRAGRGTVEANLLEVAKAAVSFYSEGVPLLGSVLADGELLADARTFFFEQDVGPHTAAAHLAAYLRAEQKRGRVRGGVDLEVTARAFLASCLGESVFRAIDVHVEQADREEFLRALVATVARGLAPKPARASTRARAHQETHPRSRARK